jgi:hypothetical protein
MSQVSLASSLSPSHEGLEVENCQCGGSHCSFHEDLYDSLLEKCLLGSAVCYILVCESGVQHVKDFTERGGTEVEAKFHSLSKGGKD